MPGRILPFQALPAHGARVVLQEKGGGCRGAPPGRLLAPRVFIPWGWEMGRGGSPVGAPRAGALTSSNHGTMQLLWKK